MVRENAKLDNRVTLYRLITKTKGGNMFSHIDNLIISGKYESAFRQCLDYHRFPCYEFSRRLEKTDLLKGVDILEVISSREKIEPDTRELITHLVIRAKDGHVSEGLLNFTVDKVMLELAGGPR
jgi:hypothetical protein